MTFVTVPLFLAASKLFCIGKMKFGIFFKHRHAAFLNSFAATWSDFVPAPDGRVIPASADALCNSSKAGTTDDRSSSNS